MGIEASSGIAWMADWMARGRMARECGGRMGKGRLAGGERWEDGMELEFWSTGEDRDEGAWGGD